jgi:hypothetical protein
LEKRLVAAIGVGWRGEEIVPVKEERLVQKSTQKRIETGPEGVLPSLDFYCSPGFDPQDGGSPHDDPDGVSVGEDKAGNRRWADASVSMATSK